MKILIIHSHTQNRGDEAAVKAMVDELLLELPGADICISSEGTTKFPNMPKAVRQIARFPKPGSRIYLIELFIALLTKGRILFSREGREYITAVKEADIVLHAPGGPVIGDIYGVEYQYLYRLDLIRRLGKKYMFYAPSMGPFNVGRHKRLRMRVFLGAENVTLRDPISLKYVKDFMPDLQVDLALDSALQHEVDMTANKMKLDNYRTLSSFLGNHEKCIGMTITDLQWHPIIRSNPKTGEIRTIFDNFIERLVNEGYGVVFIPQLYGNADDYTLMSSFMRKDHTFIIDDGSFRDGGKRTYKSENDVYDSYFQQYLIGKLYAVVGMRYHSNIFSAKMGIPFISVAYEQKMTGFMQTMKLDRFCIDLNDLSAESLKNRFNDLIYNYSGYKALLKGLHETIRKESRKTTETVLRIISQY